MQSSPRAISGNRAKEYFANQLRNYSKPDTIEDRDNRSKTRHNGLSISTVTNTQPPTTLKGEKYTEVKSVILINPSFNSNTYL